MKLLNKYPQIKPHLVVELFADENVTILLSEDDSFIFEEDELITQLIPYLNGRYSVREIILQLDARFPFTEVAGRINYLHQRNLLNFYQAAGTGNETKFWSAHNINPQDYNNRNVAIRVFGNIDIDPLKYTSIDCYFGLDDDKSIFTLVVTDDYLCPELDQFNRQVEQPWLLVKPVGKKLWLGPLIIPGKSACWSCLEQRLRLNRKMQTFMIQQKGYRPEIPLGYLDATMHMAINMAVTQVARWFAAGEDHPLLGNLVMIDSLTFERETHYLTRRPQCPVCGNPSPEDPKPLKLQKRLKAPFHDGGHRYSLPDKTIEALKVHVSPITGVIPALELRGDDRTLNVYDAGLGHVDSAKTWQSLRSSLKMRASGKGVTNQQAQASGLGEALERYSSYHDGTEKVVVARFAELGDKAISPPSLLNFSPVQYEERQDRNLRNSFKRETFIPVPIDFEQPLPWTPVWSLHGETWRYALAAYCYLDYPQPPDQLYCLGDTNGNAAGTSVEDAILQGFFELVERDCVAIWWYNQLLRPGVMLEGINDSYISTLKIYYTARGREFWVLDLTGDLGIPAFAAVSRRTDSDSDQVIAGFGAHLDAGIAILRALTEMNQSLPIADQNALQNESGDSSPARNTLFHATVADHKYLWPDPNQTDKTIGDYKKLENEDLLVDINICLDILQTHDLEMLVHELTRPDIDLPVVKVIVPGLRHFWRRLGDGRLYDVPVQMGRLQKPTEEFNMNPLDLH